MAEFYRLKEALGDMPGASVVRRRTSRLLSWAPPALVDPLVIEYRDAGPYEVTTGTQRADSYVFPSDRDLSITIAPGGVARSNGVAIRGGRNVVLMGGVIDVAADYCTAAGLSHGAPDYGLNNKNKALLIERTVDGVVHVEGLHITGDWLYEAIDVRGTAGSHLQLQNVRVDAVRFFSTGVSGTGADHDGGDIYQTQGSWGETRIDGLWARGAWFQGLFMKQESGRTVGAATLRNVYLDDYQGAGAAIYVSSRAQIASMANVFIRPTSYRQNAAGQPRTAIVKSVADTQFVGSTPTDLGASEGRPPVRILTAAPGDGYVSPGYVTA